MSYNVVTIF